MTINPNGRILWEGISHYDGTPYRLHRHRSQPGIRER